MYISITTPGSDRMKTSHHTHNTSWIMMALWTTKTHHGYYNNYAERVLLQQPFAYIQNANRYSFIENSCDMIVINCFKILHVILESFFIRISTRRNQSSSWKMFHSRSTCLCHQHQ
mmetsp:Transcript_7794/g.14690  ORF Transcript_7794/g.14690 Transcript_7794/m.14690 type:complete len:116 (+) Transcript_7794:62-409(+)